MGPLTDTPLPNHLGTSVLAFTRDGYMVLMQRGARSIIAAQYLYSTIDGTLQVPIDGDVTLYDAIIREVEEEIGVKELIKVADRIEDLEDIIEIEKVKLPKKLTPTLRWLLYNVYLMRKG